MSGRRVKAPVKGKRPSKDRTPLLKLLVVLLAVFLVLAGLVVTKLAERYRDLVMDFVASEQAKYDQAHRQEDAEPEDVVTVGGQQVEIDRTLEPNQLQSDRFTRLEDGTIIYDGNARYGIDVSAHQGQIDWSAVAADGVEFAMLRIGYRGYSEGALNQDSRFEENYQGATENGIDVGVYFFSQALDEAEALIEAHQVIQWLEGKEIQGPVVFDWEYITHEQARTDDLEGDEVTACAVVFCQEIRKAGYTPMIYCNGMLGYLGYDLNKLSDVGVWYAEYRSDYPTYAYRIAIWQYTDSGKVDGIDGNVDRNIWFLED
ncbi:MAG: glycoside hydrolase family 25 protein [Oscillospiraceae bacterium]|nr:glycoside hydrolase family 25 protein [Oscillospiraceae bacterium]